MTPLKPAIMCFSGLDPTGGAGIQADIESAFSLGCHALPIITVETVQNTQDVFEIIPKNPNLLIQQARTLLDDIPISCFKLGLLGSVANIEVIHTLLSDYAEIPVVLDPVIIAGGGFELSSPELIDAMRSLLLPLTTVLTPNTEEIVSFAPLADSEDACAAEILDSGCQHILLTGTHAATDQVINKFYSAHQHSSSFTWPRLEHSYHGSGCTLAASVAAYLAHGLPIHDVIQQAQRFTWQSLSQGSRMGLGQHLPNRSFWNKQDNLGNTMDVINTTNKDAKQ